MERLTIIVVVRDRFSTTVRCLEELLANTPPPFDAVAVMGGAPPSVAAQLRQRYGTKVEFVFGPRLLNAAESRNIGLKHAKTRLAVLMDNDVYVRAGWLPPLVACQIETGAAMVVPVILEAKERVHTAGNDLMITERNGVRYAQKVLRYAKLTYYGNSNLKRSPVDYGELHCQLVEVRTALDLGVYDERLREAGEVDSGLAWAKGRRAMFFEPASVVEYAFPQRITAPEDIEPFIFKWDMDEIRKGYEVFLEKWGLDITECGNWVRYNVMLNERLGFSSRLLRSKLGLFIDNSYHRLKKTSRIPGNAWRALKARRLGYDRWMKSLK